jgi:GMP synthase (glutamine-hydrolysing)
MRILLFQIRNPDDEMLGQEFNCFLTKLEPLKKTRPFQLDSCNIIGNTNGYRDVWKEYDIVMVGGSGDYGCVDNTDPWFLTFCDVLRTIVEKEKPMFCSCFGHQALASAMGGRVVKDKSRAELGTLEVSLNEKGQNDPLLRSLGSPFLAQFGHNDHVVKLPEGAVNLASSTLCEVQAYTMPGKPVYSTQFHPELSSKENRERAERYFEVYDPALAHPDRLKELFKPSESASALLPKFIEMYCP